MKLVTYLENGKEKAGALTPDEKCVRALPFADMNAAIEAGLDALVPMGEPVPLAAVTLLAPIPRPRQDVICLGMNYREHEAESARYDKAAFTKEKPLAVYFSKRVTEAVPPEGFIESHPGLVERLDYEAELAIVIGRTAKDVPVEKAGEHVFGYTVLNDVSARRLQTDHKQWYFGKSLDGFTPIGPWIVTADEIAFPPALAISCRVNGETRQSARTDRLITGAAEIIAELSAGMTLLPGTIIATGTPAGVGLGFDPPRFLKPGDVVECEIEKIGVLRSTVR